VLGSIGDCGAEAFYVTEGSIFVKVKMFDFDLGLSTGSE